MISGDWPAMCVAFASSSTYFAGIAVFKIAAGRMAPLRGTRPVRMVVQMLTDPVWWCGAAVMAVGLLLQGIALSTLPLPVAQPIFLSALVILLVIALVQFAERLNGAEWHAVVLIAIATAMVATAAARTPDEHLSPPSAGLLLAIVAPGLAISVVAFVVCDRSPVGQHARPSTGIALGITAGVLIGTAELALSGLTQLRVSLESLPGTPYPYLFLLAVGLGIAQLQAALQRHRMVIIVLVATAVAKTHLLLAGTVLYGLGWPREAALTALLVGGVVLIGTAVAILPRHEHIDPRGGRTDFRDGRNGTEGGRAGREDGRPPAQRQVS